MILGRDLDGPISNIIIPYQKSTHFRFRMAYGPMNPFFVPPVGNMKRRNGKDIETLHLVGDVGMSGCRDIGMSGYRDVGI
jgi:hypothetical protein